MKPRSPNEKVPATAATKVRPLSRRQRWREWWREGRPVHLFILKFVGVLVALHAITLLPAFDRVLPSYLHAVAVMAGALTHCFGESTTVIGATLRSSAYA